MRRCRRLLYLGVILCASAEAANYDLLIRNGTVFDGRGNPGQIADIGIRGDQILAIGNLVDAQATHLIDAQGMAVAPGFINMLSWATESLLIDGRGLGDLYQGVTLEVFGEGSSMGPLNESMKETMRSGQDEAKFDISWTSLGEYLEHLESNGVAPNVASFIGATTVRVHVLGHVNRPPTPGELVQMQSLVDQAMLEGALGVGSSLIYAPAFFADTHELIALASRAAKYGGMYISHIRSEGNRLLESVDELLQVAQKANARAELYHLKVAGKENWLKFSPLVKKIEAARQRGLQITANIYTYTAGSTGLDAAMPPWVQEGGFKAWATRLQDPAIRTRVISEMNKPTDTWENLLLAAGGDKTVLVGFRNPELKHYTGKTLADIAMSKGQSVAESAIDLVIEDGSRVQVIYFLMSESNLRRKVQIPWVSFGSDASSMSASGVFLNKSTHPRAYGNFARVLGKFVRDEKLLTLAEAIRKLTSLPAENLRIRKRGLLVEGYYADIVVFDPRTIADTATYDAPHSLAIGVRDVVINGIPALLDHEPTGALPGRVVRGPGWVGHQ
jgi:N-acyl-D-amino-acid deacylase